MSEDELDEQWALEQIDPLPDTWMQTGLTCATIANFSVNKPKKWLTPGDFIPFLKDRTGGKPRQSQSEMRERLRLLVAK